MGKSSPRFEFVNWDMVYECSFCLARAIWRSGFKPEVIVGISRGGWIPARILSDLLSNSNLASMKVEFYCGVKETEEVPKITQCLTADVKGRTVLVVDEIVDSGKSLSLAKDHALSCGASKVRTVSLLFKSCAKFKPDYYEKETVSWVVFPWELNETVRFICEKNRLHPEKIQKELGYLIESGVPSQMLDRILAEFSGGKLC